MNLSRCAIIFIFSLLCSACHAQEKKNEYLDNEVWMQYRSMLKDTIKSSLAQISSIEKPIDSPALTLLNNIVTSAQIIGLGEPTHGTKESTIMNITVIKHLIQSQNVRHICFEGDILGGIILNDYIHGRINKTADYVSAFAWIGIYDKDFATFIEWLREYNRQQSFEKRINLYGLGYLFKEREIEYIQNFIKKVEIQYYDSIQIQYAKLFNKNFLEKPQYFFPTNYDSTSVVLMKRFASDVVNHLEQNKRNYLQYCDSLTVQNIQRLAFSIAISLLVPDPRENTKYRQAYYDKRDNLTNSDNERVKQYNEFLHQRHRDYCLFTNMQNIIKNVPESNKIVLWAHNMHIGKRLEKISTSNMKYLGYWLQEKYGQRYCSIGYIFYKGQVRVENNVSNSDYVTVQIPPKNSIEELVHDTDTSISLIKIQNLMNTPLNNQLILMRSIGSQYITQEFVPTNITKVYDGLIYFNETTPAR